MRKPTDKYAISDEASTSRNPKGSNTQPKSNPNIDDLLKKINKISLDQDLTDFLARNLQDISKFFASKSKDIKAAVRDGIIESCVFPIVNKIAERETTLMAMIYGLKSRHIDVNLKIYQAKVRECECTIESLKAKLLIDCTYLNDVKKDLKESSGVLVETAMEIRSILDNPKPSYTEIRQSRPAPLAVTPLVSKRDSHVVLLRPKKTSTSEENKKIMKIPSFAGILLPELPRLQRSAKVASLLRLRRVLISKL
ncbi:hypothetical protein AVEN_9585-1 [Araneus ventricosus]|uniref:Uncharacterized protein n=1 Tax=Araneus ventricosus TaxID=182803 RepID=A0A4Y2H6P3_ARAVE|nr:hypothetical protein AVEN_9585-1 [Araneus ventricosus]